MDKVQSSRLDGSDVSDLVTGDGVPRCIAIHPNGHHMYWTGAKTDMMCRNNRDGPEIQTIFSGHGGPSGIALVVD